MLKGVVSSWWMVLQLPMQSMPITTNVASSNLSVTCDRFSPGPQVSSTTKTDHHDITEILLKVALNTIKQTNNTC